MESQWVRGMVLNSVSDSLGFLVDISMMVLAFTASDREIKLIGTFMNVELWYRACIMPMQTKRPPHIRNEIIFR